MKQKIDRSPIRPTNDSDRRKKLKKIKFIGVEFDYNKYHDGEEIINDALGKGYVVVDQHPTSSGIVVMMGLFVGGKKP